jgi:V/A-type H+-transporting ATPase subunit I
MIVTMKKVLFIGAGEDLNQFFARAQKQGDFEFLSISGKKNIDFTSQIQQFIAAMRVLRKQPVKDPFAGEYDHRFAVEVTHTVLKLKDEIEKLLEEKRLIETEIVRVAPFGTFSMEEIKLFEKEAHKKVQFFCMKTAKSHQTELSEDVIYISTAYDLDYFIAINPKPVSHPGMIEMHVEHSAPELKFKLSRLMETLHDKEVSLKSYAGHLSLLQHALIEDLNQFNLESAKKTASFPFPGSIFAVEAWVPKTKMGSLFRLLDSMAIHCEEIAIEKEEKIPTYMENKGVNRMGEDLVRIYDVPASTDRDPSGWVLWAFALFFAMIVADAGYGLLYLGLAVYLKMKFPQVKGSGKRFIKLFLILSTACVVWGVITSSYFGMRLSPANPLSKVSFVHYLTEQKAEYHLQEQDDVYTAWKDEYPDLADAESGKEMVASATTQKGDRTAYDMLAEFANNIMLELALLAGVIHIALSLGRYAYRNWAALGWIAFLIGGYLYFPSMLNATSLVHFSLGISKPAATEVGIQLLYGGIAFAVIAALIQRRLGGLTEILNVVQVFADVLSYLRLYALALAASIMAETFNDIGTSVGFAAGALVILAGHGVNILLGTQSGVIHGLRLNFIEWYHYSFEGGGRLFNPLKKLKPD